MAINPMQAFSPVTALPVPGTQKKGGPGAASFDTILSSLRGFGGSTPASTSQQVAAEMFRIEMMQNSLSLAGDGETPRTGGLPPLESLLAGPAPYCQARPVAIPSGGVPAAPAALPATQAPAAPSDSELGAIGTTAAQYLGTPYRFGGESADGIDCSSFVQKVFREHQINLPRTAREQSLVGSEVAQGYLRKGDLVFFHTYASYPSHVGIYLGDGKMIHASSGKGEVTVSDLNSTYYRSRFMGAKRVA